MNEETQPDPGLSTTTAVEVKALEKFREKGFKYTPHLVAFENVKQSEDRPLLGGYVTYIVMTRMPGWSAYDLRYWDQDPEEQERIFEGVQGCA